MRAHYSLKKGSIITIILKFEFSISKLPKKWKKNKKVYCCFIHCHFWCILRLFRTFRGLYFVKGRSYRQNGVEIRDLHIRNTQENRKIYKPYMVHFWPPSRNRPKMGFLDHYWTGSKGVPFDSEFHEHQEYVVIFALDPS